MEEKKTNYGKIIAITLAVIAGACAIAYAVMKLYRKFFVVKDAEEDELFFDEEDFLDGEIEIDTDEIEAAPEAEAEVAEA